MNKLSKELADEILDEAKKYSYFYYIDYGDYWKNPQMIRIIHYSILKTILDKFTNEASD